MDGPLLTRAEKKNDQIACAHMSGLMSRSHMTAAKMVSATRVPNTISTFDVSASGALGVARVLDRSITPSTFFSCKQRVSGRLSRPGFGYAAASWCAVPSKAVVAGQLRSYASPLTMSFQAIRAVLFASATATSLGGLRRNSSFSQRD